MAEVQHPAHTRTVTTRTRTQRTAPRGNPQRPETAPQALRTDPIRHQNAAPASKNAHDLHAVLHLPRRDHAVLPVLAPPLPVLTYPFLPIRCRYVPLRPFKRSHSKFLLKSFLSHEAKASAAPISNCRPIERAPVAQAAPAPRERPKGSPFAAS